jgi:ABC-2 type transport system ATP-binding protein
MDLGRVIADGTVEELTRASLSEELVMLEVREMTPLLVDNIKKVQGVLRCDLEGRTLRVTSTTGSQNLARVLECAAPYVILSASAQRPTLEDAFLAMTGKKLRDGGES